MFYIVVMLGFATGFLGAVGALVFKKNRRGACFDFVHRKIDAVCVIVADEGAGCRGD